MVRQITLITYVLGVGVDHIILLEKTYVFSSVLKLRAPPKPPRSSKTKRCLNLPLRRGGGAISALRNARPNTGVGGPAKGAYKERHGKLHALMTVPEEAIGVWGEEIFGKTADGLGNCLTRAPHSVLPTEHTACGVRLPSAMFLAPS
eukprot:4658304-Amphidinium_carterae.1